MIIMAKSFVNFWGALTSEEGSKQRAKKVLDALNKYNKNAKKVLELGAGIGTVLRHFPRKYDIYGLDIMKEYISRCKKNVPRGRYFVASMHNFKIPLKFDVIFCVYDSINFLKDFKQWESTFKSVFNHLNEKGLFIFDMYTLKALKDLKKWTAPTITPIKSVGYVYEKPIIKGNALFWDYRVFEKKKANKYELNKYLWKEKIFSAEKIKKALAKHFKILESRHFDNKRRILFVCRKKP